MPVSKSQIAAVTRYNDKTYDKLTIRVKKGEAEKLKAAAAAAGKSLNAYILDQSSPVSGDVSAEDLSAITEFLGNSEPAAIAEFIHKAITEQIRVEKQIRARDRELDNYRKAISKAKEN
jgi:uncharacterized protein (DUF1778 family)